MSEPKDLLLVIEQLRRSNRRWKALALAACLALVLMGLFGLVAVERRRVQAEVVMRRLNQALESANQARVDAQQAANPERRR
jgi:hypothetical protein